MSHSLEGNKFAAGILVAALVAMGAGKIADTLVHPQALEENAYKIEVAEDAGAAAPKDEGPTIEPVSALLASADVAKGEKVAKKCSSCHSFDDGGKNGLGPNLYNIVNAPKGSVAGFGYSDAMTSFADPKEWTYESLNAFLYKPKDYIKGTKMAFAGLKKVGDRADLISYLRTLSANPAPLP